MDAWKGLVLEPLSRLKGPFTENIVIVIDALDESGIEHTRMDILQLLAT